MKAVIQKVSIPDDWRDNMLAELDREKTSIQNEGVSFVQNLKTRKAEIEQRIDRLLDIYIEGKGISPDEYQVKKAKLLGEKADIDQEIRDFVQKGNNWLEPMREVILLSSQAKILLSQGDKTQIRAFLKNVGSNFMLNSKRLEISPKNGWRARVAGEPMTPFPNWRRGWDSNPRSRCLPTQPLSRRLPSADSVTPPILLHTNIRDLESSIAENLRGAHPGASLIPNP